MCYYLASPTFILDAWRGLAGDPSAPLWVDYRDGPSPICWTSRLEAIEIVRTCCLSHWNTSQKGVLKSWCDAVTRGSWADLKSQALHYPPSATEPLPIHLTMPPTSVPDFESPSTKYLEHRRMVVGREESPSRRRGQTLGDILNTV
ncbi:hypothetical protein FA13DRAFT_1329737 [Coprinellus micaceus]|uniref:Uncharacterized protein n=1 Tax=Coprinellus micaceus TaxID=71717 RepID=A0A4Y7SRF9_COPMI|nr:hypothetical protein FA13DRAFT_1329737 [Coprinellus micaceus]